MIIVRCVQRFWVACIVARGLHRLITQAEWRATRGAAAWIETPYLKVYGRVGGRLLDRASGQVDMAITLASVDVPCRYQRRGFFRVVLKSFESAAKLKEFKAVIVENVLNEDLENYLRKLGYVDLPYETHSLYKRMS